MKKKVVTVRPSHTYMRIQHTHTPRYINETKLLSRPYYLSRRFYLQQHMGASPVVEQ